MAREPIPRDNGSAGNKVRLVLVLIAVVLAVIRYPAARWFIVISLAVGVVVAVVLHFWNKRPVKLESDEVRLHLMDDDDRKTG